MFGSKQHTAHLRQQTTREPRDRATAPVPGARSKGNLQVRICDVLAPAPGARSKGNLQDLTVLFQKPTDDIADLNSRLVAVLDDHAPLMFNADVKAAKRQKRKGRKIVAKDRRNIPGFPAHQVACFVALSTTPLHTSRYFTNFNADNYFPSFNHWFLEGRVQSPSRDLHDLEETGFIGHSRRFCLFYIIGRFCLLLIVLRFLCFSSNLTLTLRCSAVLLSDGLLRFERAKSVLRDVATPSDSVSMVSMSRKVSARADFTDLVHGPDIPRRRPMTIFIGRDWVCWR
ncbi:hypothetical protein EGW08_004143 [Elysia chlorotica]|uniref:Uncharacterized protein n=1 Tax=Elysia chlorotica TaxID=188477 RepID=A0A3S1AC64_ELYCH|nr:hypothetical protein EGW08_004143 [Elysia chlorotica]